jgi:hypothetical protein
MVYSKETYSTPPGAKQFVPKIATQLEAEEGTEIDLRSWSPVRIKQAISEVDPTYTSQAGVPTAAPLNIGLINGDTLTGNIYISTGSSSITDWVLVVEGDISKEEVSLRRTARFVQTQGLLVRMMRA